MSNDTNSLFSTDKRFLQRKINQGKLLNKNKKVIAVPRLEKYGEHVNDHQLQIIENFDKEHPLQFIYIKNKDDSRTML